MPHAIPLTKRTNHPIMIGLSFNPRMGAWDITVGVGNFATEKAARDAAKGIKEALEDHLGTTLGKAPASLEVKDN